MKKFFYYLWWRLRHNAFIHKLQWIIAGLNFPDAFHKTDCTGCQGYWVDNELVMVSWCDYHKEKE